MVLLEKQKRQLEKHRMFSAVSMALFTKLVDIASLQAHKPKIGDHKP
jgi:hypothetical protein